MVIGGGTKESKSYFDLSYQDFDPLGISTISCFEALDTEQES